MSATSSSYIPVPDAAGIRPRREGSGWVLYAGLLLVMAAVLNIVSGIAAIDNSNFFSNGQEFVFSNLETWGWIHLVLGIVIGAAAFGVFARNTFLMWVAIAGLMCNAISQLFFIAASPWWAISVFALDTIALYGLVVHGFDEES